MSTARSLIAGAALSALTIALGAEVASAQLRGPIVELSPAKGEPGAEVTTTVQGFGKCPPVHEVGMDSRPWVDVSWDGDAHGVIRLVGGKGDVSFRVPEDAGVGSHQVTAVCRGKNLSDTAEFVVVSPAATSTRVPDQDDRDPDEAREESEGAGLRLELLIGLMAAAGLAVAAGLAAFARGVRRRRSRAWIASQVTVTPNGLFEGAYDVSDRAPGYDPGPLVRVEARLGAGEYVSEEEHP